MRYMTVPARCFVWNPQTLIADYAADFVRQYIKVAFPAAPDSAAFHDILAGARVDHDVCSASYSAPSCLIYLQNDSDDHHVKSHMEPFIERLGQWRDHDSQTRVSWDRRIIIRTGNWGKGHAVPPTTLIQAMIGLLRRDFAGDDPMGIALRELPGILNSSVQTEPEYDLAARATLHEGEVSITIDVSRLPAGLTYAYYLMEDGVRAALQWYSSNTAARFRTEIENAKRLSAVVFARSGQNAPTIRNINVNPTFTG
ncbi:hypothetical protein [Sinorhizobium fredii]|nr:hypothetical protein [Sinorhizobium fredii]